MAFLELKNSDIGFTTPLLKGVNSELHLGEVCLLMGNNGVGKTTLIKTILNQIPLLNGEINLNSSPLNKQNHREIAEQIAVVFSKAQIPNHFTVQDLIAFGKYIHYPYYFELNAEDKTEVQQLIIQLKLENYANTPLVHLSDGNLQKAFIGRALAQNSPFIILDEPTTHLDESNKIMILKLIRDLAKTRNKLILFSSHDWRLAKDFSDKIWHIKDQQLFAGVTEDILIQHQEVLNNSIYPRYENLNSSQIIAPQIQQEMLYSLLQKNNIIISGDLIFEYKEDNWLISTHNQQQKLNTFEEILCFLRNYR